MNLEQARYNMVEQQIRTWNVLDPDVLDLLFLVKREEFVPAEFRRMAFADVEIPLGGGVSMLAPKIEAHAMQALAMKRHEKVLEVGAGSGFMAALLGAHADQVWSLEIDPAMAALARANLQRAGVTNVNVVEGDGLLGLPEQAPFDAIMVSGGVARVPNVLREQLKVGGRLFAIVGEAPAMSGQLVTRLGENDFRTQNLFETVAASLRHGESTPGFAF